MATCPFCHGTKMQVAWAPSGVAGDTGYDFVPCDDCAGTGQELPEDAMPWDVQVEAADEFAASDEFMAYIDSIMDEAEAVEA